MTLGRGIALALLVIVSVVIAMNAKKLSALWRKTRVFYDEVLIEMKKVAWPTKDHVINSTVLVGVISLIMVVMVGIVDKIFGELVAMIFTL